MSFALSIHDLRLNGNGSALTAALRPGQIMVVVGPAGSGKTRFLRAICGLERGYRGSIRLGADVALAGYPEPTRRSTPESIARKAADRGGATRAAEALGAARLWEARRTALASLTPGQEAAAELLVPLASPAKLLVIDGEIERLDPWTKISVLDLLWRRASEGAAIILATSLPDLAARSDLLVAWKQGSPVFAGAWSEAVRRVGWTEFEVETKDDPAVRALCDPFEVRVEKAEGGLKFLAKEGQAVAARMLLEGYGDVKLVVQRPPSAEEVLEHFAIMRKI